MSAGHTPGPWVATERHGFHEILGPREQSHWFGSSGVWAVAYADTDREESEQEANARLIAAAPELLAELIALRRRFHNACIGSGSDPEFVAGSTPDADSAIAKATGAA